jgi:hypothetical protein
MLRFGLILLCLFGIVEKLWAQEIPAANQAIEDLIEEIAGNSDENFDYTQLAEDLFFYAEHPLNLNAASTEALEKLHMLNDFQIKSLQAYLFKHGAMLTLYELQLVMGFDAATIEQLLPFVMLAPIQENEKLSVRNALKYGRQEVFSRGSSTLETADGYKNVSDSIFNLEPEKHYPGNPWRIYTKYKFNYRNRIQFGITAEKDPGEQFFSGTQKNGFDYYSMHFEATDIGLIKTLVAGDYQVKMGQGLIMWSGMSTGKSVYVMDIRKRGSELSKYASTDENLFMRGAGFTLQSGAFTTTLFASHKQIDANLQIADSLADEPIYASSLLAGGIHATPSQIADKDALGETIFGGHVSYQKNVFKVGVSGLSYLFSKPIQKDDVPQNQFLFQGRQNQNLAADVQFMFKALHIFGEAALSANGGKALLAGALMALSPQLSASVLYRNYAKDYQALYANAFAEGARTQNEKGFYLGLEMHPIKNWKLSGYYDFYQFPWLTSSTDVPAKGNDYLVQADFVPNRRLTMYWRFKHEIKEHNSNLETTGIDKLTDIDQWNGRYQIVYAFDKNWQFKNRVEVSHYQKGSTDAEYGFVLYQDISCQPFVFPLNLSVRYALFDTESYNSRIYTYESDVLYAFSIPALYDKGSRFYLVAKYEVKENLTLWMRYAQTYYANKTEIGSGLDKIGGHVKSEIKLQMRWKF